MHLVDTLEIYRLIIQVAVFVVTRNASKWIGICCSKRE